LLSEVQIFPQLRFTGLVACSRQLLQLAAVLNQQLQCKFASLNWQFDSCNLRNGKGVGVREGYTFSSILEGDKAGICLSTSVPVAKPDSS
jgi:hypothetical protein